MIQIQRQTQLSVDQGRILSQIIRQTPIRGAVPYHYDRPLSYDHFAKIQGTHFEVWEARENETTVGFTQITFDRVNWNGQAVTVAYSGDTRVIPQARGRRIADVLIQSACSQDVPVFGAVLASNKLVLDRKLADWDLQGIHFRKFATLKALLFRPTRIQSQLEGYTIRVASQDDLPSMFELWKTYSETRNLSRNYPSLEAFAHSYQSTPGVSLDHTVLILEGTTVVAMLSLWNQSTIRPMILSQKTWMARLASGLIPLPDPGNEIKALYSFQHAFLSQHPHLSAIIRTLISKARSLSHQLGSHLFLMGLDDQDPAFASASKQSLMANTAHIILDHRGNRDFETSDIPLHLEVGMG